MTPRQLRSARRLRGQALVLGLLFVFAIAGITFFMFNSGRAVDEKLRITNAADAAAYSVALMEARALNYDAHVNRAIVANQIAIAQAVGLASWLRYYESGTDNVGTLSGIAASWLFNPDEYPRLAQLIVALGAGAYAGGSSGYTGMTVDALETALAGIVRVHDTVSNALSLSQRLMHASLASGVEQQRLADDILAAIDPQLSASIHPATHDFPGFTQALGRSGRSGDARGRLADVVLRSRDDFSRQRSWSLHGPDIPFVQRNVRLKRRGGTDLIGYDEWRALDTLEHEGQRWRKGRWRWRRTPVAGSAASVAADAGDGGESTGARGFHGGSYRDNSTTSTTLAEPAMRDLGSVGARYSGLPETRELRDLGAGASYTSGLTLRVAKRRAHLRTSGGSSVVQPSGRLRQFDAPLAGGDMVALARAEVFFERPQPRTDGKTELPSLYSPFRQVRLVNPTTADRAWAAAQQDGLMLP